MNGLPFSSPQFIRGRWDLGHYRIEKTTFIIRRSSAIRAIVIPSDITPPKALLKEKGTEGLVRISMKDP